MCHSNLVVLLPSENCTSSTQKSVYKANQNAPTYTRDQLLNMSSILKQSKYCILPFQTIKTIRKYRINRHPRILPFQAIETIRKYRINRHPRKLDLKQIPHKTREKH